MNDREATPNPIATLQDVAFSFGGSDRPLLRNIGVRIDPGDIVLLSGANGSGKSTILGLLSGRLAPGAGRVRVLGCDPFGADRLPAVGLITEPFHPSQSPLPVGMTAGQILTWLEIIDGIRPDAVRPWLARLNLSDALLTRPLYLLSKGERQRVMLLVVLLRRPRLILANEPLDGVDAQSRTAIGTCMARYARENESAVVWVEHHVIDAVRYANRMLHLEDGVIAEAAASRYTVELREGGGAVQTLTVPSLHLIPELLTARLATGAPVELTVNVGESNVGESL